MHIQVCVYVYVWCIQMLRNSSFLHIGGTDSLKSSAESFKSSPSIDTFGKILFFYIAQVRNDLVFALL